MKLPRDRLTLAIFSGGTERAYELLQRRSHLLDASADDRRRVALDVLCDDHGVSKQGTTLGREGHDLRAAIPSSFARHRKRIYLVLGIGVPNGIRTRAVRDARDY